MCIILSLFSPEYATSQQAEATSTPEEMAPQSGKKRKVATGRFGHTRASDSCTLKGKGAPPSTDPATTASTVAAGSTKRRAPFPFKEHKSLAKKGESAASRYVGLHCPVKKANIVCSDGTRVEGRQRCKVCSTRVNTYCEQCDVALCFGDYEYPDESCFKQFHTCSKK